MPLILPKKPDARELADDVKRREVAERIKHALNASGKTRAWVASEIGLSNSAIYAVIGGQSGWPDARVKLCEWLGLDEQGVPLPEQGPAPAPGENAPGQAAAVQVVPPPAEPEPEPEPDPVPEPALPVIEEPAACAPVAEAAGELAPDLPRDLMAQASRAVAFADLARKLARAEETVRNLRHCLQVEEDDRNALRLAHTEAARALALRPAALPV